MGTDVKNWEKACLIFVELICILFAGFIGALAVIGLIKVIL